MTYSKNAQGTIEYLIVIAIIVVIGLVVVGISSGFLGNAGQISTNTTNIGNATSTGIIVQEAVVDYEGSALLSLQNNTGEEITLKKITIDDQEINYNNKILTSSNLLFSLPNTNCACFEGEKSKTCIYEIQYTTKYGLEKKETIEKTLECVDTAQSIKNVIEPINLEPQEEEINYFIFKITTTEDNQTFSFQTDNAVDLNINWGDGEIEVVNGTALREHNYQTAGDYNIWLQGSATRISYYQTITVGEETQLATTPTLLKDIYTPISNGITGITSAEEMFRNTTVVSFTSQDFFTQTIKDVNNTKSMFYSASFNQNISDWNVESVLVMDYMFSSNSFNQPIGTWNTKNVNSMYWMFSASSFNQNISDWNTSNVTNMDGLFLNATSFNQDLSEWNVSNVANYSNFDTGATSWQNEFKPQFN